MASRGSYHQLLSLPNALLKRPEATTTTHTFPSEVEFSNELPPLTPSYGEPRTKPLLNLTDCLAVLLSIACLGVAAGSVSPSLHYAADLQFTRQIIVLGFALGIMNQCLLRVAPHLFLLLETRTGSSTLQNYDGIIRWTPLADKLAWIWRAALTILLVLPLGLGIAYKRYAGGIGVINVSGNGTFYTPTYPYGLSNVGQLSAIANITAPFMAATANDSVTLNITKPRAYGYNILLLSNTSSAAVDAPNQVFVRDLQNQLGNGVRYNLTAPVRALVATYNATAETHRNDTDFWDKYLNLTNMVSEPLQGGTDQTEVALLHIDSAANDDPKYYDSSWAFLGIYTLPVNPNDVSLEDATQLFQQKALGFDIDRYQCNVTWEITSNSMELVEGTCDPQPLDINSQFLKNCQTFFTQSYYLPLAGDCVGPFNSTRVDSPWKVPTYATIMAAMFWSKIASQRGYLAVQAGGYLYDYWNFNTTVFDTWQYQNMQAEALLRNSQDWKFNETYPLNHTILKQVPTLESKASLYFILAVQPLLTVVAFIGTLVMYSTPISRGFGMVSVMAGVNRESVDLISGAAFSGKLTKPTGMRIKIHEDPLSKDEGQRVEYVIGEKGHQGEVRMRARYH